MKFYVVNGVPYSDELYHYGIKGQKWGIRKYQNEDGSLTALGKIRYGAQKAGHFVGSAGRLVGKGISTIGKRAGVRIKDNHNWMMSDEELNKRIDRLEREKRYKDLIQQNKPEIGRGRKIVGQILEEGSKTLARGAFNAFTNKLFAEKPNKSSPSYQFVQRFKERWESGARPDIDELKETSEYISVLRAIEGTGGGKNGGKKGGK